MATVSKWLEVINIYKYSVFTTTGWSLTKTNAHFCQKTRTSWLEVAPTSASLCRLHRPQIHLTLQESSAKVFFGMEASHTHCTPHLTVPHTPSGAVSLTVREETAGSREFPCSRPPAAISEAKVLTSSASLHLLSHSSAPALTATQAN